MVLMNSSDAFVGGGRCATSNLGQARFTAPAVDRTADLKIGDVEMVVAQTEIEAWQSKHHTVQLARNSNERIRMGIRKCADRARGCHKMAPMK